ncbi:PREDICTED: serine/threonine-protein kinase OXI1-like [Nelumbo nucifera]|uniref:non-specific serine/threonine protein kinase n=2 Tax=Nelumbo nucifera TaxID=4432 RepID=A0A1U7Z400_NELNU|nr:PREDICTED: serine/threonine-protein kinase OXI1-like [Nelumbo nucifera]DAD25464.1 TPA_asm: hypothetical protein HUJ06_026928 [Nelumbo nucifera]
MSSLNLQELKVLSVVGRGAKSVVFVVRNEAASSREILALKVIYKTSIQIESTNKKRSEDRDGGYRRIMFEREALKQFNHPLLPKLRGLFATNKFDGFVMDYCSGGDLNSLRKRQTEKMFSEEVIRFYASELVLALEYLHGLGIVYRDLKPENIVIQETGHLMLVDFDLSTRLSSKFRKSPRIPQPTPTRSETLTVRGSLKQKFSPSFLFRCNSGISGDDSVSPVETRVNPEPEESVSVDGKSNSFVGTEEYVSPEVILGNGHDFAVDWWGLGVVLYEMLYGRTPFRGSNRKETFFRILTKEPELIGEQTSLRDLIRKLLEKDPTKRISLERIKGHDFFRGLDWKSVLQISRPPFIPAVWKEEVEGKGIDVEMFVSGHFCGANLEKENYSVNFNKEKNANGYEKSGDTRKYEDLKDSSGTTQFSTF